MASTWVSALTDEQTRALGEFFRDVAATDRRPMVTTVEPIPADVRGGRHYLTARDGELAGYAHLADKPDAYGRAVAEAFTRPRHRGHGVGTELVTALLVEAGLRDPAKPDAAERDTDSLRVWSHGDHPAAARLATRHGFTRAREMLRMRADLDTAALDMPTLPENVRLRAFEPGRDEEAVVAVNARAFDWHPEQGAFTVAELRAEENADWFDPDGFFLAERDDPAGPRLVGFHWTKVHPWVVADPEGGPVGEVYVVGVDPTEQGGGLGRALTIAGLRHLRERGLRRAMLYVESDNPAAIRVYDRIGFRVWDIDVQYSH